MLTHSEQTNASKIATTTQTTIRMGRNMSRSVDVKTNGFIYASTK
jgi:hypothetical protein